MLSLALVYYLRLPTQYFDKLECKSRNLREEFAQMMDALISPMQSAASQSVWGRWGTHSATEV